MANSDLARGFISINELGTDGPVLQYVDIEDANTERIGKGDPVSKKAGGGHVRSTAGDAEAVQGVAWTFLDEEGSPIKYLPALTAGKIGIIAVPGKIFSIQISDGATTAAVQNNTVDFVAADCDIVTGESKYELNYSTLGTDGQCRIEALTTDRGNEWAEHANVNVIFVESSYLSNANI